MHKRLTTEELRKLAVSFMERYPDGAIGTPKADGVDEAEKDEMERRAYTKKMGAAFKKHRRNKSTVSGGSTMASDPMAAGAASTDVNSKEPPIRGL